MPRRRSASSPALLAIALLCAGWFQTGCRKQLQAPPAPLSLPNLDFAASSGFTTAATDNLSEDTAKRVVCLLADARVPFTRAQAQLLQHLDAGDARHEAVIQEAQGDASLQAQQLTALTDTPPFALLIEPLDLTACLPTLKTLQANGTRILLLDPLSHLDRPSAPAWEEIVCDPRSIGQQAASQACAALARRARERGLEVTEGRILELRGSDASTWSQKVHEGFVTELHRHPGIVLVHDAPTEWDPVQAKKRFTEAWRLQSPFQVVFAHDDFLAQAVHQEATQQGVRDDLLLIGVNGFPGPEGGLRMLHRQEIDLTLRRPYLIDLAWQSLTTAPGTNPPRRQNLPVQVIRPLDLETLGLEKFGP